MYCPTEVFTCPAVLCQDRTVTCGQIHHQLVLSVLFHQNHVTWMDVTISRMVSHIVIPFSCVFVKHVPILKCFMM